MVSFPETFHVTGYSQINPSCTVHSLNLKYLSSVFSPVAIVLATCSLFSLVRLLKQITQKALVSFFSYLFSEPLLLFTSAVIKDYRR